MPSQAPTPRTTRNSRGLRTTPSVSSIDSEDGATAHRTATGRVPKRRRARKSPTPPSASLVNALAPATKTEQGVAPIAVDQGIAIPVDQEVAATAVEQDAKQGAVPGDQGIEFTAGQDTVTEQHTEQDAAPVAIGRGIAIVIGQDVATTVAQQNIEQNVIPVSVDQGIVNTADHEIANTAGQEITTTTTEQEVQVIAEQAAPANYQHITLIEQEVPATEQATLVIEQETATVEPETTQITDVPAHDSSFNAEFPPFDDLQTIQEEQEVTAPSTPVRAASPVESDLGSLVRLTPPPTPVTPIPEVETATHAFRARELQEGGRFGKFANELYKSIVNDHLMRGCKCPLPKIYDDREEALRGEGHLRFYYGSIYSNDFEVIQHKDDLLWHCTCNVRARLDVRFREHFNRNRKRPATDSEFDLIARLNVKNGKESEAENQGAHSIERIVAEPVDAVAPEVVGPQDHVTAQPMWSYVASRISAMGASMFSFVGKLIPKLTNTDRSHEVIETRRRSEEADQVVVKRFKLQHNYPLDAAGPAAPPVRLDELPGLTWATDPARWIGHENIERAYLFFRNHMTEIKGDNHIVGGFEWETIQKGLLPHHDALLVAILHHLLSDQFGAIKDSDPEEERYDKWVATLLSYEEVVKKVLNFITNIYMNPGPYAALQVVHPRPPSPFILERAEFRLECRQAAEFLLWLVKMRDAIGIPEVLVDILTKIIADANAIHKRELIPSWIEFPGHNQGDQLRARPASVAPDLIYDAIPVDEFNVEPAYALRYPATESPRSKLAPDPGRGPIILPETPKKVLKKSKIFPENVPSPEYVSTPLKRRKVAFESPIEKFAPPNHIPIKTLAPWERESNHELLVDQKTLDEADEKHRLSYHAIKYTDFLDDMRADIQKRLPKKAPEPKPVPKPPVLDGVFQRGKERVDRMCKLKKELREMRLEREQNPILSPESKHKAMNELSTDMPNPEEEQCAMGVDPHRRPSRPRKNPNLPRKVSAFMSPDICKKPSPPPRPEGIDRPFTEAMFESTRKRLEAQYARNPRKPLSEYDFGEDLEGLAISTRKLEELQLSRQIRDCMESAAAFRIKQEQDRLLIEESRRIAEAELKRLEAERKRAEERRLEEERLEAKRRKEAEEDGKLRPPRAALITPLSSEWDDRVTATTTANPSTQLCVTLDNTPLVKRDFAEKLLPQTAWLNDNVIIGAIAHVADSVNKLTAGNKPGNQTQPKCIALTSWFYHRLKGHGPGGCARLMSRAGINKANFLEIDTILAPICEGDHWTLAVVRPKHRVVAHLDSLRGGHGREEVQRNMMNWVRGTLGDAFVKDEWRVVEYDAPQQRNGYDCGVFTITNAMCLALGVDPLQAYDPNDLTLQRRRVAAVLLNGGFIGDFSLEDI